MGTISYKGYKGSVDFSEQDNCLYGKVLGIHKTAITYEGQTVDELRKDFQNAIDDYFDLCKQHGIEPEKPYSGTLNIRLTPEIHSRLAMMARTKGTTINALIRQALASAVGVTL